MVKPHSASVQHPKDVTLHCEESVWAPVCFLLTEQICRCLQIQTKLPQAFRFLKLNGLSFL